MILNPPTFPKDTNMSGNLPIKRRFFHQNTGWRYLYPRKKKAGLESRWCSFSLFNSVIFRSVLDFRLGVSLASTSKFFGYPSKCRYRFGMTDGWSIFCFPTKWTPASYRWSYNPCKWPKGNGCFTCVISHIPRVTWSYDPRYHWWRGPLWNIVDGINHLGCHSPLFIMAAVPRHLQVYEPFLQEVFQALREAFFWKGEKLSLWKKTVDVQRRFSTT